MVVQRANGAAILPDRANPLASRHADPSASAFMNAAPTSAPAPLTQRYPRLAEMIGIDLRTLALFRIVLGLVRLWSVLCCFRDLTASWTARGMLPRAWLTESARRSPPSPYLINGQPGFVPTLLLLHASFAPMFAPGWRTLLVRL